MRTDLAPDTAAFLASLAQAPRLSFRDMPITDAREAVRAMADQLDARPDLSVAAEDGEIANGGHAIALRLYSPPACRDGAPVILFLHGGGWVAGDLDSYDSFCRFLAGHSRMRVASVDYRRAPETPFPGALEDALTAAQWLASGNSTFGTVGGLVLAGDSAGGGLAVAIAGLEAAAALDLRALLLFYPVLDVANRAPSYAEFSEGFLLEAADMAYFIDSYVPDAALRADPRCSPLLAFDAARMPPVALLTCGHDVLRDEGRALADACRAAGVACTHVEASGHIHGIITMRNVMPTAIPSISETIDGMTKIIFK